MSLSPSIIEPVPAQTVPVDRLAFPKAIFISRCVMNLELYLMIRILLSFSRVEGFRLSLPGDWL